MAVTIAELIGKKDEITKSKKLTYELETSVGEMVFRVPDLKTIADAWEMKDNMDGNKYLVMESAVTPNLKDKELQKAYGCGEPFDIVEELFQAGEISQIATKLLDLAGFKGEIKAKKILKEVKNC